MWEAYEAKGTKYPFSNYVAYIQRQRKGLVGGIRWRSILAKG